jgi:hypothetical protein
VAHKRPPCDSMIDRLMGSPIPVPLSLVVKNALKIWSPCSGVMLSRSGALVARGRLFDARDEVLSWFGANDPVAD